MNLQINESEMSHCQDLHMHIEDTKRQYKNCSALRKIRRKYSK